MVPFAADVLFYRAFPSCFLEGLDNSTTGGVAVVRFSANLIMGVDVFSFLADPAVNTESSFSIENGEYAFRRVPRVGA